MINKIFEILLCITLKTASFLKQFFSLAEIEGIEPSSFRFGV